MMSAALIEIQQSDSRNTSDVVKLRMRVLQHPCV